MGSPPLWPAELALPQVLPNNCKKSVPSSHFGTPCHLILGMRRRPTLPAPAKKILASEADVSFNQFLGLSRTCDLGGGGRVERSLCLPLNLCGVFCKWFGDWILWGNISLGRNLPVLLRAELCSNH
ncbi:Hypothetical predicted protein [Podarcis lilfordi]|uniref:Uncharacterized protein n=1 Tax=Podarcis lilfordi TaxID=74358 RepID=A0AA35LMB1_9SAUR|nr:Hypothetical predicted protein [Podarcis lilfordi]